jgi:hypothetical protein
LPLCDWAGSGAETGGTLCAPWEGVGEDAAPNGVCAALVKAAIATSAGFEALEDPAVPDDADAAAGVRLFCAAAGTGPPSEPPLVSTPDAAEGAGGVTKGAKIGAVAIAAGSCPSSASNLDRAVSDRPFAAEGEDEGSYAWADEADEAARSSAPRSSGPTAASTEASAAPSAAAALGDGRALGVAAGLGAVKAPACRERSVETAGAAASGALEVDALEVEALELGAATRSARSGAGGDVGKRGGDEAEAALGAVPTTIPDGPASPTSVDPDTGPTDVGPGDVGPGDVGPGDVGPGGVDPALAWAAPKNPAKGETSSPATSAAAKPDRAAETFKEAAGETCMTVGE